MINAYDIAYYAAGLAAAPYWLLKSSTRRKVFRAIETRMGRVPARDGAGPAVLIHAVSLGEINATRALVQQLHAARPDLHVIVSATTETGHARGQQLYGTTPNVTLIRFPLDLTPAIARALDNLRPDLVVLMELEVWPNFLKHCHRRNIPVMVINARLTPHSLKRYRWISPVTRTMFSRLAAVGAQDQAYAGQFASLGVPPDRVAVTGTMKFDTAEIADTVPGAADLAADLRLSPGEPLWTCGSTGPGEEQLILAAYRELLREFPALRLAIIPRHPDRFDEVAQLIEQGGYPLIRRSNPTSIRDPQSAMRNAVLLGDTMGELRKFYSLATVVLVGRTLLDLGPRQRGSDMIEPAALAKPTLVGPWTQNFTEVMAAFRSADAMLEVPSAGDIGGLVAKLLREPTAATAMGERARRTVTDRRGATASHARMILDLLPKGH